MWAQGRLIFELQGLFDNEFYLIEFSYNVVYNDVIVELILRELMVSFDKNAGTELVTTLSLVSCKSGGHSN